MNIILANADFSANNLGRIDLRTEPSVATQAILDVYGKTWDLPKQLAIDDFLTGLNALSFKSKIKRVVAPILSPEGDITPRGVQGDWFYDLITDTRLETFYNTYANPFTITPNGLKNPNGASNQFDFMGIRWGLDSELDYENIHYGVYSHQTNTDSEDSIMKGEKTYGVTLAESFGKLQTSASEVATFNFDVNTKYNKAFRVFSHDSSANPINTNGLADSLPLTSVNYSNVNGFSNGTTKDQLIMSKFTANTDTTISLITVGEALTVNETFEYNSLISALMDVVWVD